MRSLRRLRRAWRSFRSSLLFAPAIMTAGAVLLFLGTSWIDARVDSLGTEAWPGAVGFLVFGGSAEAATSVLTAIAGSWATIVGVVYSVTLVTIQLSATKYTAQVIPSFERDRYNQLVLGAFAGTFTYALLVLKSVRVADDGLFAPVVGVNVAILLAVTSLFLFVGFVANLAAYIRPTRFVEDLGARGLAAVPASRAPLDDPAFEIAAPAPRPSGAEPREVTPHDRGYLGPVDWRRLRRTLHRHARRGRALPERLRIDAAIGESVGEDDVVVRVFGGDVDAAFVDALLDALRLDTVREAREDPFHAAESLGDIALTAMSGGSTDVGIAKSATHAVARIASAALLVAPPEARFVVVVDGGRVEVERATRRLDAESLGILVRILDKAVREGYWDVGLALSRHLPRLAESAARAPGPDAWPAFRTWAGAATARMLAFGDADARARMLAHWGEAVARLREGGEPVRAEELAGAVFDAAAEAGQAEAAHAVLAR